MISTGCGPLGVQTREAPLEVGSYKRRTFSARWLTHVVVETAEWTHPFSLYLQKYPIHRGGSRIRQEYFKLTVRREKNSLFTDVTGAWNMR
jgi:hypothetical protein